MLDGRQARCATQVGKLLAKGHVLDRQVRAATEGGSQRSKEAQDHGRHRAMTHDDRPQRLAGSPSSPPKQAARMTSWRGSGA